MKSRENVWGLPNISSVGQAVKELRHGLRLSLAELGDELGLNPATINRYENETVLPPVSMLHTLLRLALIRSAPGPVVRMFAKELAEASGETQFAVLLSALVTLEGPDAPRHVTQFAKQALQILENR